MTLLDMARELDLANHPERRKVFDDPDPIYDRIPPTDTVKYPEITDADLPDILQPQPQPEPEPPAPTLTLTPPPAPADPSQPHKIKDAGAALAFIMAGNAYFTIRSMKTGMRYTFRVNKAKENPRFPNSDPAVHGQ